MKSIILFCCIAATFPLFAQTHTFDSVRVSIARRSIRDRFEVMEHFSDSLLNRHPYLALPFTDEAASLAHELGNKNEEGYLLNSLGKAYQEIGEFDRSGDYVRQAMGLNRQINHDYEIARGYNLMAVTYHYMGLYNNAMEFNLKALTIFEQLHQTGKTASVMTSIGTIYLRLSQYNKARDYFTRALSKIEQKDTVKFVILLLNNIAAVQYHQNRADSALLMLDPLLKIARRNGDRGAEAYTLFNIGSAFFVKNDFPKAEAYLKEARTVSSSIHEAFGEAEALIGIAQVYEKCGKCKQELSMLDEAIPYCRRAKTYDLLRIALKLRLTAYEKLGDTRHSYSALKDLTQLTDSVSALAEKIGVANAVFSYDLAKKEDEIVRLRRGALMDEVSIKRQRYQIYALIAFTIIVILTSIALMFMYRKANRLRRTEREQKTKIEALYTQLSELMADRNLADEHARQSQQKFQSVWEKSADGMRLTDRNGILLMVNEAFCRIVGMEREELMGKPLSVIYDQEHHASLMDVYVNEFTTHTIQPYFEREFVLRSGRAVWFEVTSTYLDIEEQPTLLLGIFRDVTQRKKLEQQLVQSQKLEGIGTLAGGIAHDFNNLLSMILGSAEMLKRQITAHPELQKYVDYIVEASSRGTSISRQLLIFSRPDQAELKPISLSRTIVDMQEMLTHFLPKSIAIKTFIEAEDDTIMGDAGQIEQALLNLVINAGDAMINSGTLTIRELSVEPETIKSKFPQVKSERYIALRVTDTGIGMDDAVKMKIFDPFFTTKERSKGTGLGLSSVHGIVKNHHGLIDVESAPGAGTTFTLYFPAITQSKQEPAEDELLPDPICKEVVLVVDDEPIIRETLAEFLLTCGYQVHTAAGGREALELFRIHHHAIDIVITDLGMPDMGGEELFGHLRTIDPHVRVIVSSGYLDGTTRNDLLGIGVKEILAKPVKIHSLQSAIRSVMSMPGENPDAGPFPMSAENS
jgi:PAS domain S-box-containing protein